MNHLQIVWKGILPNTMEYCTVEKGDTITVKGSITGLFKQTPLHCNYTMALDAGWNTQSISIQLDINGAHVPMGCYKKENSWYDNQDALLPELDGCTDVDINLTPFTNALPINRLQLAQGVSKEISVIYFDLLAATIKPVKQKYTRLGANTWLYDNVSTDFTATLETDENGIVINYPGIWERVYP